MTELLAVLAPWTVLGVLRDRAFLRPFQIEEYDRARFLGWWARRLSATSTDAAVIAAVLVALSVGAAVAGGPEAHAVAAAAWLIGGTGLASRSVRPAAAPKKPLVFTRRAILIFAVAVLLRVALAATVVKLAAPDVSRASLTIAGAFVGVLAVASPTVLAAADVLLAPWMAWVRRQNVRRAHRLLSVRRPTVIGITGSYGKTSTKEFVAHLLRRRHAVAKTPQSYNTILGISSAVIDGLVRPNDRYLVAELAAYSHGEIQRIASLLRPAIGVVTAIGPQHLERFGSLEAVATAKYELIEALPADGLAVFNADDELCYALYQRTRHVPALLYGWRLHQDEVDVSATEVESTRDGLRFVLESRALGISAPCQTRVLGMQNVSNVLGAVLVALRCNVPFDEIVGSIADLAPVSHRLELKQGAAGTRILDDSYNSNPVGAREALGVLAQFTDGSRVLVTPGLTELGERERDENRALGRAAAEACDVAILIGERGEAMRSGFVDAGFPQDRITLAPSLRRAMAMIAGVTKPGATILFLNDLPDTHESDVRESLFGG